VTLDAHLHYIKVSLEAEEEEEEAGWAIKKKRQTYLCSLYKHIKSHGLLFFSYLFKAQHGAVVVSMAYI